MINDQVRVLTSTFAYVSPQSCLSLLTPALQPLWYHLAAQEHFLHGQQRGKSLQQVPEMHNLSDIDVVGDFYILQAAGT